MASKITQFISLCTKCSTKRGNSFLLGVGGKEKSFLAKRNTYFPWLCKLRNMSEYNQLSWFHSFTRLCSCILELNPRSRYNWKLSSLEFTYRLNQEFVDVKGISRPIIFWKCLSVIKIANANIVLMSKQGKYDQPVTILFLLRVFIPLNTICSSNASLIAFSPPLSFPLSYKGSQKTFTLHIY